MTTSQGRKHRGYKSQDIVAQYLQENGHPYALSAGAGRTGSDVTGVPWDIEIKARRGLVIAETMSQLKARSSEGQLGFGVLRLDGMGPASIKDWCAIIRFEDLVVLLNRAA
jgi:hypothetical protein